MQSKERKMTGYQIVFSDKSEVALEPFIIPPLKADEALIETEYSVVSAGTERANLLAFGTTYTSHVTRFFGNGTFVFVHTTYVNAARFRPLLAQLDNVFRTGFHAGSTSRAFVFYHFGQHGYRVYVDGIERTRYFAIAQTVTAERAAGVAAVKCRGNGTVRHAIV